MKRLGVWLGAFVLVGAACGGGDSTEVAGGEVISPFSDFLGEEPFDPSNPEAAQLQFEEQERERQQIIAECMKGQGFEYVPVDPEQYTSFGEGEVEWGTEEWTNKYGFGVTTMWFPQESVGPDLVGNNYGGPGAFEDPNWDIQQELSPAEQEAYQTALYGEDAFASFEPDESLSDEELEEQFEDFQWEPGGCEGEAYNQSDNLANRFYQEFDDEITEMYERVEEDPRIIEAETKVRDCVAEEGLEFTSLDDVYSLWDDELSEIDSLVSYPGEDLTDEDFAALSEAELEALYNQVPTLPDEAKEKLAELQAEEIALAQAVSACGGGFDQQFELFNEVLAEYEAEFLDTHADRLEDLKAGS